MVIMHISRGFAVAIVLLAICTDGNVLAANRQQAQSWIELYEPHTYKQMPYRLMKPIACDLAKNYPVIVSLHGAGGKGTDNCKQLKVWNKQLTEKQRRIDYPCYVLAPQSNNLWNQTHLKKIKDIIKDLPSVDMNRIYILGHSMGGHGTYIFIQIDPDYFAAAAPSAGSGLTRTKKFVYPKVIRDIPIWAFHGDKDKVCPISKDQKIFSEMKKIGGNMKFTTFAGDGHGIPQKMITGADNGTVQLSSDRCDPEPDFLKWLFKQTRSSKNKNKKTLIPNKITAVITDNAAKIKTDLEKIAPVTVITEDQN